MNSIARNPYLFGGFIAIALVLAGLILRRLWRTPGQTARRFAWLITAVVALGGVIVIGYPYSVGEGYSQLIASLVCLSLPVLSIVLAVLTYLLLKAEFWRDSLGLSFSLPIVLLATVLFALLQFLADLYFFFLTLVGPASAFIWKAFSWRWTRAVTLLISFSFSFALLLIPEVHPLANNPAFPFRFVFSGFALLLAGNLIFSGISEDKSRVVCGVYLVLSIVPLGVLGYHLYVTALWDGITDGLGIVIYAQMLGLLGIIVAIYIGIERPERRMIATGFAVMVAFVALVDFTILVPTRLAPMVTARRAETIDQAVIRYRDRHESYPGSLDELGIWYQTRLYEPIMFRDQTWCYQGGERYYRLGYVYRPGFNPPPEMVRIVIQGSAGEPPASGWVCDEYLGEALARLPD